MRYILTAILAFGAGVCQAKTSHVDANGMGDYPTIQAAVDDSNTGDVIILMPGKYIGAGNKDIDTKGKSLTIQSTDPCNPAIVAGTVIDCQNMGSGFNFVKGESPLLAGFTITNGNAFLNPNALADTIYSEGSSPTIFNCVIKGNHGEYGYPIVCYYSTIKLIGCDINDNTDTEIALTIWDSNAEITGCRINKSYAAIAIDGTSYPINDKTKILYNVKITDSTITNNYVAIDCLQANLTIEGSTISDNNRPSSYLGAVNVNGTSGIVSQDSNLIIKDSIISRNNSISLHNTVKQQGGGIAGDDCAMDINNCIISDNKAGYCGGGIAIHKGSATIRNCQITNNIAGGRAPNGLHSPGIGGGIFNDNSKQLFIEGCTIKDNKVARYLTWDLHAYGGGGICSYGSLGTVWIKNTSIIGNNANDGGGIYDCSYMDVNNCLLANNEATFGGGIENGSAGSRYTNCTFAGNKAAAEGAGIYGQTSNPIIGGPPGSDIYGQYFVNNCILWDVIEQNSLPISEIAGEVSIKYSDVRNGYAGEGNINIDPCFVDSDYHLHPDSPCIDAGDPNFVVNPGETDLDGNPRIVDLSGFGKPIIDMGAYEAQNNPPIAEAGPNQIVYAWINGKAEVTLDGSASYDTDGDALTYLWKWTIDGSDFEANEINPTIELPAGIYTIELVVNDGRANSEPNYVEVNVTEPIKGTLRIMPRILNNRLEQKNLLAMFKLPAGITRNQIDLNTPVLLYPGEIQSAKEFALGFSPVSILAFFGANELLDEITGIRPVQLYFVGQLKSGQYFYGTDTLRIINPGHPAKLNLSF